MRIARIVLLLLIWFLPFDGLFAQEAKSIDPKQPQSFGLIDGEGPDWKTLGQEDFTRANCDEETFVWNGPSVRSTESLPASCVR